MQGFVGLSDEAITGLEPWLRFSPAVCAAWAGTATWAASPATLGTLTVFAVLGAVLPQHPFDAIYNHGARHVTRTPPIPRYAAPRRFACVVAAAWLAATTACFAAGAPGPGYALGALFTLVALVPVATGFCVPSFVYGLVFNRRAARAPART